MTEDDKFDDQRHKDPERSVHFKVLCLVLRQLADASAHRVSVAAQEAQVLRVPGGLILCLKEATGVGHGVSLLLRPRQSLLEFAELINELLGLIVRMERPQTIHELADDLVSARIEVGLVLVRVKDVPLEHALLALTRAQTLVRQVAALQSIRRFSLRHLTVVAHAAGFRLRSLVLGAQQVTKVVVGGRCLKYLV